jgi:hypothetical protein
MRNVGMISTVRSAEIDDLVDAFVHKVNSRQHERLPVRDVPQFLRRPSSGAPDPWTDWQIHKADNSRMIEDLEGRMGRRFPASYRSLVARYCFPAFDCGPLFLFANTGADTWDELSSRVFRPTRPRIDSAVRPDQDVEEIAPTFTHLLSRLVHGDEISETVGQWAEESELRTLNFHPVAFIPFGWAVGFIREAPDVMRLPIIRVALRQGSPPERTR